MSFWDTTIQFFWRDESLLVMVMALALALLLLYFHKEERRSITNTLGFFFACLLGQFLSSLIHAMEFDMAANVLHEAFVIGGGIALIRLWGLLVFRIILPYARMTPPRITEDIFVIIAYIAWGLVRLRYAGLDLGSIVATSAMITAVVAFAMQDTLGNILGGLALQLDNSIQIGDWIKVDDIAGRVVDIRWRSTLGRNAQLGNRGVSQQPADEKQVHGAGTAQRSAGAVAPLGVVQRQHGDRAYQDCQCGRRIHPADRHCQCGEEPAAQLRVDGDERHRLCALRAALLAD